jgi:hypothetical protein
MIWIIAVTDLDLTSIKKRILIVTTWRSGSTFLGDLIKSAPGVFYSFEPLLYLDNHPGSKTELIQSLFHCRFSLGYLRSANGLTGLPNDMQRNKRVWSECIHNRTLCSDPEFVAHLCSSFPIHLIKTVRFRVRELPALLESDPVLSKELKIIHLVRDPRAIMTSRAKLKWCQNNPACKNASRLCADMEEDLQLMNGLVTRFPNQHYRLKFEDLAVDVEMETDKLFRFLEMPVTVSTRAFLDSHTKSNDQKMKENFLDFDHSTYRKSDAVAYGWKKKMGEKVTANITEICKAALEMLNVF